MYRNLLLTPLAICFLFIFNTCGSDTTNGSDDDSGGGRAATSSGAAVGAVFGGLSSNLNASEPVAKIPSFFLMKYLIRKTMAQTNGDACNIVESGEGENLAFSLDGTDRIYGHPDDAMEVGGDSDLTFCADGGDVAAWTIDSSSPSSPNCTEGENSFTTTVSGSGIFRVDTVDGELKILVRGEFTFTTGEDSFTSDCSFNVTENTFAGEGCEGTDAFSTSITCESPDDGGGESLESLAGNNWTAVSTDCGLTASPATFTEAGDDTYTSSSGDDTTTLTRLEGDGSECTLIFVSIGACSNCSIKGDGSSPTTVSATCNCPLGGTGTITFSR